MSPEHQSLLVSCALCVYVSYALGCATAGAVGSEIALQSYQQVYPLFVVHNRCVCVCVRACVRMCVRVCLTRIHDTWVRVYSRAWDFQSFLPRARACVCFQSPDAGRNEGQYLFPAAASRCALMRNMNGLPQDLVFHGHSLRMPDRLASIPCVSARTRAHACAHVCADVCADMCVGGCVCLRPWPWWEPHPLQMPQNHVHYCRAAFLRNPLLAAACAAATAPIAPAPLSRPNAWPYFPLPTCWPAHCRCVTAPTAVCVCWGGVGGSGRLN